MLSSRRSRLAALAPLAGLVASLVLTASSPASASANLLSPDAATFSSSTGRWVASGASLARVASPNHMPTGALRASATAAGNIGLTSGGSIADYVRVTEGATYAGDAFVRAAKTPRTAQAVLTFYDGTGTPFAWAFGAGVAGSRTAFVRTPPAARVAPEGARYLSLGIIVYGAVRSEVHYVDTARVEQTAAPVTASAPQPLLGFFDKPFGDHGDVTRLAAAEQWQGRGNAVVGVYTNFDPNNIGRVFPQMRTLWERGNVPMVSWMPWIGNTRGPDYNAEIARGVHDGYLRDWAAAMKTFLSGPDAVYGNADDRRAYLRFAHEPNGDWYPYAPAYGGTPASSYVAMWHHVHDVVVAAGIDDPTRLAWVFSVNNVDGPVAMESLYPGDAYVDWVGIDGYNWGTSGGHRWETPSEVFDPMVRRLRAVTTRPIGVNEVAATTDGATVADKSRWITDYFAWVKANGIRMTMWFNDYPYMWEIFGGQYGDEVVGGYNAYSTYRSAAQDPAFVSSDAANPRLLTDAQFTGR